MPTGIYERSEKQKNDLRERGRLVGLSQKGKKKNFSEEHKKVLGDRLREQAALKKGTTRLPFSNEWRKKMSESRLGKAPWNKGKTGIYSDEYRKKIREGRAKQTFSEETRRRLSNTHKKRVSEGKNHFYKGGIYPINLALRNSLEYKLWRESVFKRDKFCCVLCGDSTSGNIEADHIMPFSTYPELRFDIDNGRTLCKPCHRKTDTYGPQALKKTKPKGK
ncbi:MAG: HNH endonuclease signature motif containing protein [Candidatus Paceibacterota bacterium]